LRRNGRQMSQCCFIFEHYKFAIHDLPLYPPNRGHK
jgi:hypothetical protein